ncbi:MAG: amidohydrolase/deacetylase family metallohydrolase [Rhodospirillales bacterium]|nr:amidohydrolase/deacetylase family metallohydrolase [Rhodospirillales bacterium]
MAATTQKFDLILRGGHVIDPAQNRDGLFDVGVRGGKIASVAKGLKGAKKIIDVTGAHVLPGMIDTHAHVYRHITGKFGLEADWCGVGSGVTTLIDQGGPSSITIDGFRKYVVEASASRVVSFISTYLVGGMEGHMYDSLHGPDQINVKATVRAINDNRDIVKGIKTHAEVGGASRWGVEVLKLAKKISRESGLPIYVHLGQMWPTKKRISNEQRQRESDELVRAVAPLLDPGDILAHPFTRHPGGFISGVTGEVHPVVRKAIDRGVLVDVGHGSHFDFNIARSAIAQGIVPYTLGADMHGYNVTQPGEGKASVLKSANPFFGVAPFSLCIAMTELLMLGMDFTDVVKTVTCNAAIIAGMQNEIGTLKRGRDADVSVIDIKPGSWKLSDNSGNHVISDKIIVPRFTLRMGERFEADSPLLPAPVNAPAKTKAKAQAA